MRYNTLMHPIRKSLYALAALLFLIPGIGWAIMFCFAAYADYKGWRSEDVGG